MALGQVINYETVVEISDKGEKTTKRTLLIQINSKEENWLSHVELIHNPKQEFTFEYAQITDLKGNIIRKLKKKELVTRNDLSYQAFYQDDLITEFDLYWNQYPYRIEYSYTIQEEEYLFVAWWTPLYDSHVSTMHGSLEVRMPPDYAIRVSASEELSLRESEIEGSKMLIWEAAMTKVEARNEIYSPSLKIPSVKIVPEEFNYGVIGKSGSWSSFGNWVDQLNQGTDLLPLEEKRKVANLIDGLSSKNEIIKTIYYYLQDQTKYVNVSIDVGGLKSYPASYVCKNKYGDCKALTTYMKAMLNSVGIESLYTIIRAGIKNSEIELDFPSQQFNHVVLMIPSETDTVWLENTSSALPFNYLGTYIQNRHALAVRGDKSQLVRVPALSMDDVLLERSYRFQKTGTDELEIRLGLRLRGKEFEDFRYFISENDQKRQMDFLPVLHGIEDLEVGKWNVLNFHRDSTSLQLNIQGRASSAIRQIGTFQVINPLRIQIPEFEKPEERTSDVHIDLPVNRMDNHIYDLRNFDRKEIRVPEGVHMENSYGSYSVQQSLQGGELSIVEKFTLFPNKIPIENYPDFYEFIRAINNYKKKAAILLQ